MGVEFGSTSGYLWLDTWILANIIQLSTHNFCRKYLSHQNDPTGRQYDQMTQAARSVAANIAEGSSRHQTSYETEMKLIDVARASLSELSGDYMFQLMNYGRIAWSRNSESWKAVHSIKLDKPCYSNDLMHDVTEYIIKQRKKFSPYIDSDDFETAANSLLILCGRLIRMIQRQLEGLLEKFRIEGGFTENLTKTRIETIKLQSTHEGNPQCPKCGKPMVKRTIKKGQKQGQEFWGCIDYPACDGSRPL